VLHLTQSVDDTAWPAAVPGLLFASDSTHDTVDVVTGDLRAGLPVVVATPCGANAAPATCPAPPAWRQNYLATLDPWTGGVHRLVTTGAPFVPQGGLDFVPDASPDAAPSR
jgi:hypothetical protein